MLIHLMTMLIIVGLSLSLVYLPDSLTVYFESEIHTPNLTTAHFFFFKFWFTMIIIRNASLKRWEKMLP